MISMYRYILIGVLLCWCVSHCWAGNYYNFHYLFSWAMIYSLHLKSLQILTLAGLVSHYFSVYVLLFTISYSCISYLSLPRNQGVIHLISRKVEYTSERRGTPGFWNFHEEEGGLESSRDILMKAHDPASPTHSVCATVLARKGFRQECHLDTRSVCPDGWPFSFSNDGGSSRPQRWPGCLYYKSLFKFAAA